MIKFTIQGELTDLNNYTNAQRTNYRVGNRIKQDNTVKVHAACLHLGGVELKLPVKIKYEWYAKNKRKDMDNIAFAKKFIQDGMMSAEVIKNDGWSEIAGWSEIFFIDKDNPRIEVTIYENGEYDD